MLTKKMLGTMFGVDGTAGTEMFEAMEVGDREGALRAHYKAVCDWNNFMYGADQTEQQFVDTIRYIMGDNVIGVEGLGKCPVCGTYPTAHPDPTETHYLIGCSNSECKSHNTDRPIEPVEWNLRG